MSAAIPFVRDFVPRYGEAERLTPRIRRVLARNPGPFTFAGTGTFIVGNGASVAVIDPGPDDAGHLAALLKAVEGETVTAVLVTHGHADHLPLARPFAQAVGAPVLGHVAVAPDTVLGDGDEVPGDGWTLRAVATPGHAAEHLAFALPDENALFSGDHVMGWSTSVVSPPEGDMDAYMDSLERVIAGNYDILWPTHGGPVTDPLPFLEALKAHRLERDRQVLDQLAQGTASALDMVPALYAGIDRALWPAAAQSLLAHLIRLDRRGDVIAAGEPSASTTYQLRG
ncbi:MBL fold metallo-hydrolase [Brevundimonas poindexterae]|uniref:MBL fold metallo-hydrolase n=1 Tax=Brevundimonas poindexterae TaxID=74325 RepID=UPI001CFE560B|nr:MBL fold metallo-hydrolase [Brevundimonas poindexterae]